MTTHTTGQPSPHFWNNGNDNNPEQESFEPRQLSVSPRVGDPSPEPTESPSPPAEVVAAATEGPAPIPVAPSTTRRPKGNAGQSSHLLDAPPRVLHDGRYRRRMLGGYEAARATEEPLKGIPALRDLPRRLLAQSPWILNSRYLGLSGCAEVEKEGLDHYFLAWGSNRAYYFYRLSPKPNEHPVNRKGFNLRAVYREFYDRFFQAVANEAPIAEEEAREFWISVADRVPFIAPPPAAEPSGATVEEPSVDVSTDRTPESVPAETAPVPQTTTTRPLANLRF